MPEKKDTGAAPVIEYQPIEPKEHYIVVLTKPIADRKRRVTRVIGLSRNDDLNGWPRQAVKFLSAIGGKINYYGVASFHRGIDGALYWSTMITDADKSTEEKIVMKSIWIKQDGDSVSVIKTPAKAVAQPSCDFTGPVGDFAVVRKPKPDDTWKHVENSRGHVFNHAESDFAYPVCEGSAMVIHLPVASGLYASGLHMIKTSAAGRCQVVNNMAITGVDFLIY
jgi:hypothetical protein